VVKCGVRQDGILSPYLFYFAVYMDELMTELRQSNSGLHICRLFVGCVVYADDIALLSASCYGLQRLTDVCDQYCGKLDVVFNPSKSQLITFGGPNATACAIHIVVAIQYLRLMKKALRETQTLRAGCGKAEPKFFTPPQTPSRGRRTAKI